MTCFLVIGSPRSGSSCVAGLIHKMGIPMTLGRFAEAQDVNPTGIFEDEELSDLISNFGNDHFDIETLRDCILKRCSTNVNWGFKCAYLINCFDLFVGLLPKNVEVKIINSHRSLSSSKSSAKHIWLDDSDIEPIYNSIQDKLSNIDYFKIDYDDLIKDKEKEILRLSEFIGVQANKECFNFIDKSLKHF